MNTAIVTVTAKDGQVIVPNANPSKDGKARGYIRVESSEIVNTNGWDNEVKRSALIKGEISVLEKRMFKEGQVIGGRIQVVESLTPFYPGQEPKRAGKDGAILTHNGSPIYRESYWDSTGMKADVIIEHDKATVAAGSDVQA